MRPLPLFPEEEKMHPSATVTVTDQLLEDLKKFMKLRDKVEKSTDPSPIAMQAAKAVARLGFSGGHKKQLPVTVNSLSEFWNCDYQTALYRAKEALSHGLVANVGNPTKGGHIKLVRVYDVARKPDPHRLQQMADLESHIMKAHNIVPR